ncbi:MAG TPA: hypothetical protein VI685_04670, partial [Candidatus Angelobacter sp.]
SADQIADATGEVYPGASEHGCAKKTAAQLILQAGEGVARERKPRTSQGRGVHGAHETSRERRQSSVSWNGRLQ